MYGHRFMDWTGSFAHASHAVATLAQKERVWIQREDAMAKYTEPPARKQHVCPPRPAELRAFVLFETVPRHIHQGEPRSQNLIT